MAEILLACLLAGTIGWVAKCSAGYSLISKLLTFILIFYSTAPLFEFDELRFFQASISYQWRSDVFIIYIAALLLLFFPIYVIENYNQAIQISKSGYGLKFIWMLAVIAFCIDLYFNLEYMLLPKAEYIYAMPHIYNNLVIFNLPAIEILSAALLISPFSNHRMKAVVLAFGLAAVMLSLVTGVRHVLMMLVLIIILPRVGAVGMLVLLYLATFLGELTNVLKLAFDVMLGPLNPGDMLFLIDLTGQSIFRVSGEQMAILSNLLIKLDNPHLLDFNNWLFGTASFVPFLAGVISSMGMAPGESTSSLIAHVGAGPGQGTAYSIHLVLIESLGLIMIYYLICLLLCIASGKNLLIILGGEVFYSIMRNGSEYWLYLSGRLLTFMIIILVINYIMSAYNKKQIRVMLKI